MRMAESGGVARANVFPRLRPAGSTQVGGPDVQAPCAIGSAQARSAQARIVTPAEARAIARDAYMFAFPLVENYRIQHAYFVDRLGTAYKGPWNQIHHDPGVCRPDRLSVLAPNPDMAYSHVGADLRAEPLVLTMPAVECDRYYSAQFVDMHTHNFAYVGSRTTGNYAGRFLLVGPRWSGSIPHGITSMIRCETEFAFVRYRTQLFAPEDIDNVRGIQAGYTVQTLSSFLGVPAPPPRDPIHFIRPINAALECMSLEAFNVLNFVLQFCPIHQSERTLMSRLARLGIGPGRTFDAALLSPDVRIAIEEGIADAWLENNDVARGVASGAVSAAHLYGPRSALNNNYRYRMAGVQEGIYAHSPAEVLSFVTYVDEDRRRLDATAGRYALRFAPRQLPPVRAFWSLTLYELPSLTLNRYPLGRCVINSRMLPGLKRDADGGLTIRIQHESPGAHDEPNWLPAPQGRIRVVLRLYAPASEAQRRWRMPSLRRVEQVQPA